MKKTNRYNCIVNSSLYNGIWEITQISDKQIKLNRVEYKSTDTSYSRNENTLKIYLNNYSNIEKRIVGKHSFKIIDDKTFLVYPFRQGIPYKFDLINADVKLKGLFNEL